MRHDNNCTTPVGQPYRFCAFHQKKHSRRDPAGIQLFLFLKSKNRIGFPHHPSFIIATVRQWKVVKTWEDLEKRDRGNETANGTKAGRGRLSRAVVT